MNRKLLIGVAALSIAIAVFSLGYVASAANIGPLGLQPSGTVRVGAVSAFNAINTSSTTFVDVPGLSTTFSIPSGKKGDVIIQFSGEVNSPSAMNVRALVDVSAADPNNAGNGPQIFWGVSGGATTQGFNFYKFGVGSGSHIVKMQWDGDSGSQFMIFRSMIVFVNIH
jgi:hypothetical protein